MTFNPCAVTQAISATITILLEIKANRNKWLKTHIPNNNLYDVLRLKPVEECYANLPSKMILARFFYAIIEMYVSSITG